jgi:hypothetical protein
MKLDMNVNDPAFIIEIKERLARIETILNQIDFNKVSETANEALQKAEENAKDISELQGYVKWFVMAVLGAFIAAVCALVLK